MSKIESFINNENTEVSKQKESLKNLKQSIEKKNSNLDLDDYYTKLSIIMDSLSDIDFKWDDNVASFVISNHIMLLTLKYWVDNLSKKMDEIHALLKQMEKDYSHEIWEYFDDMVSNKEIKSALNKKIEEIFIKYSNKKSH